MAITIKDIARYAGVSVGTASKVINRQGNVREDLRLRVEAIIEKLSYRPSALARSFKRKKTDIIGLIIPQVINSFYIQVIDAIEKKLNRHNYTLFLGNSDENIDTEMRYLRKFADLRIDGLILSSTGRAHDSLIRTELAAYASLGIPVVALVRKLEQAALDTIDLDNVQGSREAVRYLLGQGHRRIGIISSSEHSSASQERIEGYLQALAEYRVPYDRSLIHVGGLSVESGGQAVLRLLDLDPPPTAIFIASAYQLLGAYGALRERKIRIPDAVSLICFDDTEWSSFVEPPLTVVKPHTDQLCDAAIEFLFERIEGRYTGAPRFTSIPTQLIIRASVRKI